MNRPSGDQTGAQSSAASAVSMTAVPPAAATVRMSRWALLLVQKAMRLPDGDHAGWNESKPVSIFAGAPPLTSTIQIRLCVNVLYAVRTSSEQNAMRWPSGDHAGLDPKSVTRRADSPVAP